MILIGPCVVLCHVRGVMGVASQGEVWPSIARLLEESAKGTEAGLTRILGTTITRQLLDAAQTCMMLWLRQIGADDMEPAPCSGGGGSGGAAGAGGAEQGVDGGQEGEEELGSPSGGRGTKRGRGSKAKAGPTASGKEGVQGVKAAAGSAPLTHVDLTNRVNAHANTLETLFKTVQGSGPEVRCKNNCQGSPQLCPVACLSPKLCLHLHHVTSVDQSLELSHLLLCTQLLPLPHNALCQLLSYTNAGRHPQHP